MLTIVVDLHGELGEFEHTRPFFYRLRDQERGLLLFPRGLGGSAMSDNQFDEVLENVEAELQKNLRARDLSKGWQLIVLLNTSARARKAQNPPLCTVSGQSALLFRRVGKLKGVPPPRGKWVVSVSQNNPEGVLRRFDRASPDKIPPDASEKETPARLIDRYLHTSRPSQGKDAPDNKQDEEQSRIRILNQEAFFLRFQVSGAPLSLSEECQLAGLILALMQHPIGHELGKQIRKKQNNVNTADVYPVTVSIDEERIRGIASRAIDSMESQKKELDSSQGASEGGKDEINIPSVDIEATQTKAGNVNGLNTGSDNGLDSQVGPFRDREDINKWREWMQKVVDRLNTGSDNELDFQVGLFRARKDVNEWEEWVQKVQKEVEKARGEALESLRKQRFQRQKKLRDELRRVNKQREDPDVDDITPKQLNKVASERRSIYSSKQKELRKIFRKQQRSARTGMPPAPDIAAYTLKMKAHLQLRPTFRDFAKYVVTAFGLLVLPAAIILLTQLARSIDITILEGYVWGGLLPVVATLACGLLLMLNRKWKSTYEDVKHELGAFKKDFKKWKEHTMELTDAQLEVEVARINFNIAEKAQQKKSRLMRLGRYHRDQLDNHIERAKLLANDRAAGAAGSNPAESSSSGQDRTPREAPPFANSIYQFHTFRDQDEGASLEVEIGGAPQFQEARGTLEDSALGKALVSCRQLGVEKIKVELATEN